MRTNRQIAPGTQNGSRAPLLLAIPWQGGGGQGCDTTHQLLRGTATHLTQQAALLQVATSERQQIRSTLEKKIEQPAEEMRQMIAADRELDCAVEQSMDKMDAAARHITGCVEEEEGADEAAPTPAGSSTDTNMSTPAGISTDHGANEAVGTSEMS